MGFRNILMLAGLAAVAIPIIIHLLNRRRAKVIDWGAMQFLLSSVAARNRRIMIEEIILMVLRCLLVSLIVVAMAHPYLARQSKIPWALVLPLFFIAVICIGIAGAMWRRPKPRWILLLVALGLLTLAGGAASAEYVFQQRIWPSYGGGTDVAVVVDGSVSMQVRPGGSGPSNFEHALGEAAQAVDACGAGDSIALIVAGSHPRRVLPGPTSNKDEIHRALRDAQPTGGSLDVLAAMEAAASELDEGHNTARKVILITDEQSRGWSLADASAWQRHGRMLSDGGRGRSPQVICRTLELPETVNNATIEDVSFSRTVIGMGRPVEVSVTVRNYGESPVPPSQVQVETEGDFEPQTQGIAEIQPKASQVATFALRFDRPGPHVVTVRFTGNDDIEADNVARRVVDVIDEVPVLIVDSGPPGASEDERPSWFLRSALSPTGRLNPRSGQRREEDDGDEVRTNFRVRTVRVRELAAEEDLSDYSVVVLADVPALPDAEAERVAEYVSRGGGLLVTLGGRADPGFYNHWYTPEGARVTPARLADERKIPPKPVELAPETFTIPGMVRLIDEGESEAESVLIKAYRPLEPFAALSLPERGLLMNHDPAIVEAAAGRGTVLMTPVGFDGTDSNWTATYFFAPFIHECAYHLAETTGAGRNVRPGAEVPLPAARGVPKEVAEQITVVKVRRDAAGREEPAEVSMPVKVAVEERTNTAVRVFFDQTSQPGLYRFRLPAPLAQRFEGTAAESAGVPFAVVGDPKESNFAPLLARDLERVRGYLGAEGVHVRLDRALNVEDLKAMAADKVPGGDLWEYFAWAALAALIAEIVLTRWIASQRRAHTAESVAFGTTTQDIRSYQAKAREMVAVPPADKSESAGVS